MFTQEPYGMKIITSNFAYKTKSVVRGKGDSRRPNTTKPLYRRKTIHIPLIYKIGNQIICAPEIAEKLKREFSHENQK